MITGHRSEGGARSRRISVRRLTAPPHRVAERQVRREMPLVLFDVDGTLLDAGRLIAHTMIQSFLAAGEAPPRPRDIRSVIGLSLPQMVDVLASDAPRTLREKIVAGYRLRYFDAVENEDPPVFDGAEPAILRLKAAGVQMGLTTGKSQRSLDFVLERMRWRDWFATIQTADDNPSKPDPTMIVRALAETGREASDTILVGDTRYDMRMARAAGVPAIGVGWGYNAPDELRAEGASAIATDFGHLVSILSAWRQTHDDAADMAVRDV